MGKISAKAGKKLATSVLKNHAQALDIGDNFATAAACINPKAAISTLREVIKLYHEVSTFEISIDFILSEKIKKQID